MDVKTQVVLEVKKNDRIFSYCMPAGAPFGEAYDAAYEILQQIIEFSKKATETLKQPEVKEEEPKS